MRSGVIGWLRAGAEVRPATLDEALVEAGPVIWSLCRRLDDDPEDAFQAVFARIGEGISRFERQGTASLKTWCLTVGQRVLVDRHRRRRVRGEVLPEVDIVMETSVDEGIDAGRWSKRLEEAITHLPEDQRRVVLLHHLGELDLETIAKGEGLALGTVKSRLHRGRARLAELLGGSR